MSTEKIAYIYKKAGKKLEIIGVGGVKDAETAMEKIMAGASLIQVVSGIRGEGLSIASKINQGLIKMMDKMKVKNIFDLVGTKAAVYQSSSSMKIETPFAQAPSMLREGGVYLVIIWYGVFKP